MEYGQFLLSQEFNKNYSDVLNCKVVAPPYYPGEVPQTFFFAKRDGFAKAYSDMLGTELDGYDRIYDFKILEIGTVTMFWFLVKQSTDVKLVLVKYDGVSATKSELKTMTYVSGVNYKFFYMPHVRGEVSTVANASSSSNVLTGSTATWRLRIENDTNATWWTGSNSDYAGKYLYLYDGTDAASAWVWQVIKVDYKQDARYLDVTGAGWKTTPNKLQYKMFGEWGNVLAFVGSDYVYTIPTYDITAPVGTHLVLSAKNVSNPIDQAYTNNRLYFLQRNVSNATSNNVLAGGEGFFALYYGGTSLIGAVKDALNIVEFQNYVLVLSKSSIDTVAQITAKINEQDLTLDVLVNVTRDVTIFKQNAFVVYNEGLYVFTDSKKFFAVTITSANIYRYQVLLQNQGIYMQKFFDGFATDDEVSIFIEDSDIYLFKENEDGTEIFLYDSFYKGWHRWSTSLRINGKTLDAFYGKNLYELSDGSLRDDPAGVNLAFNQNVQLVVGEDNVFSLKKHFFTKVYVGDDSTSGGTIRWTVYAGGKRVAYERALSYAKYFEDVANAASSGLVGTTLMGTGIYVVGGDATSRVSPVTCIEIPAWFTYELCIIDLTAADDESLEIGGLMAGYDVLPPQITPYRQVA